MEQKDNKEQLNKNKTGGVFGYIKHLFKDPVKNLPEAKARKKEILRITYISLAVAVIPQILSGIFSDVDIFAAIGSVAVFVGGIPLMVSLFLLYLLKKITKVLVLRECTNCKEQIGFDENVKYEVLREWVKKETTTKNGVTNTRQTEFAQVQISCVCQKCGTGKQFVREFRLAEYYNGNLKYSYSLDSLVKGLFTGEHIQ